MNTFTLISHRPSAPSRPIVMEGSKLVYCPGCGFAYDPRNEIAAAQHKNH